MRKIERHPSNQGSVITFDMYGKEVNLFVADAKYRTGKKWGTFGIDIPSLCLFFDTVGNIDSKYADATTQSLPYIMSDADLQTNFYSFPKDKSAKENTDILMQYKDTDAAHWCRSIELEDVGALDLPNIYELMVIYLESDRLDELDPTVTEYNQYALGKLNPIGRFDFNITNFKYYVYGCWSSTLYDRFNARAISPYSNVTYYDKCAKHGVIPVKEL